jgi:hypothetical protein
MPLASRATQARAARTNPDETPPSGSETADGPVKQTVQPRRGKPAVAPTVPPQTPDDDGRADAAPPVPEKAPRKPRTPRAAPPAAEGTKIDAKALKARQKEIEQEFKRLAGAEKIAMRELATTYKTQRQALEGEHRLIANQLSAAVFGG